MDLMILMQARPPECCPGTLAAPHPLATRQARSLASWPRNPRIFVYILGVSLNRETPNQWVLDGVGVGVGAGAVAAVAAAVAAVAAVAAAAVVVVPYMHA